ncbi:PLP-dependent cysteine synthase family protein [Nisaea sediminum]|uniref:PLP-dependent cysteine synthase family protein n=1 Tax=Nisaea sediminum TaxID=2775867 RepID=UPI0029C04D55|nr:cysteine synthase family protein [Nisaea sediminum]
MRGQTIIDRIGNSPLIELRKLVPAGAGRVLLKLESENPTGSMKDRMALAMVEAAERDGRLPPGGPVVEYTGGSTGVSLAMVCAVKGYPLHIVTSDAFSLEKRRHMQALGAKLTVVPSDKGAMDAALTRAMIAEADRIQQETGAFWTDQLNNADQLAAYHAMGAEIWEQTGGRLHAFVQATGTAASARGVSEFLKERGKDIRTIAIEPAESAVLSGGPSGKHRIEGVGAGFVVPLWDPSPIDEIAAVSTMEAMAMSRRLAREEGLFAGTSTGANVLVALREAERLGPDSVIVTVMCDSGVKYLSTELYTGETRDAG